MTALELLRRRLYHRGQTLLPALAVLLAAAALDRYTKQESIPRGGCSLVLIHSHFLCLKNHNSPATSSTLAAMMAG